LKGVPGEVQLIDGSMKECDSPGVINPNTRIIIDDAGLPDPTNGRIRGRLIVKFDIEFPDTVLGTEPIERDLHNLNIV
jgi:DnaJ-class molecular chaperone